MVCVCHLRGTAVRLEVLHSAAMTLVLPLSLLKFVESCTFDMISEVAQSVLVIKLKNKTNNSDATFIIL